MIFLNVADTQSPASAKTLKQYICISYIMHVRMPYRTKQSIQYKMILLLYIWYIYVYVYLSIYVIWPVPVRMRLMWQPARWMKEHEHES